jgi:hypothetical protein
MKRDARGQQPHEAEQLRDGMRLVVLHRHRALEHVQRPEVDGSVQRADQHREEQGSADEWNPGRSKLSRHEAHGHARACRSSAVAALPDEPGRDVSVRKSGAYRIETNASEP